MMMFFDVLWLLAVPGEKAAWNADLLTYLSSAPFLAVMEWLSTA